MKTNWTASDIGSAAYLLQLPTPTFDPVAGTYTGTQNVTISCAVAGATIRYTTDGTEPTENSPTYAGPVGVDHS